jgi:hypothetical protein
VGIGMPLCLIQEGRRASVLVCVHSCIVCIDLFMVVHGGEREV